MMKKWLLKATIEEGAVKSRTKEEQELKKQQKMYKLKQHREHRQEHKQHKHEKHRRLAFGNRQTKIKR